MDITTAFLVLIGGLMFITAVISWAFLRKGRDMSTTAKPAAPSPDYVEAVLAEPETAKKPVCATAKELADEFADLDALQLVQSAPVPDGIEAGPQSAPKARKHSPHKSGVCKYCKGEYAVLSAHEKICKFRKGGRPSSFDPPRQRRHRRTNAEIEADKATQEAKP